MSTLSPIAITIREAIQLIALFAFALFYASAARANDATGIPGPDGVWNDPAGDRVFAVTAIRFTESPLSAQPKSRYVGSSPPLPFPESRLQASRPKAAADSDAFGDATDAALPASCFGRYSRCRSPPR